MLWIYWLLYCIVVSSIADHWVSNLSHTCLFPPFTAYVFPILQVSEGWLLGLWISKILCVYTLLCSPCTDFISGFMFVASKNQFLFSAAIQIVVWGLFECLWGYSYNILKFFILCIASFFLSGSVVLVCLSWSFLFHATDCP